MFGESIMQSVSDRFEDTIGLDEYLDDSADDFLDVMESAFGLSDERDLDEIGITDDDLAVANEVAELVTIASVVKAFSSSVGKTIINAESTLVLFIMIGVDKVLYANRLKKLKASISSEKDPTKKKVLQDKYTRACEIRDYYTGLDHKVPLDEKLERPKWYDKFISFFEKWDYGLDKAYLNTVNNMAKNTDDPHQKRYLQAVAKSKSAVIVESAFGYNLFTPANEAASEVDDIDDDDMDDDIIDGKPGGDGIMIEATMYDDDPDPAEFEDDAFDDIIAHPAKESLAVTDPVNTAIMDDLDIESKSYDDFFIDDDF